MRVRSRLAVVLAAAMTMGSLAIASPARADVIEVFPGQSIQAAVDAAQPGDTVHVHPGTYRENVLIDKNGIWLRGSGTGRDGTIIAPPRNPNPHQCTFGGEFISGICVMGQVNFDTFEVVKRVRDVHISGVMTRDFPGTGVLSFATHNLWVEHSAMVGNHDYGIFGLLAKYPRWMFNTVRNNVEPAIYLGDSPASNALIRGNTLSDNLGNGLFVRNASVGVIMDNKVYGNCVGMLFLQHEGGDNYGWDVTANDVHHNSNACPAHDEEPPLSGVGIAIAGSDRNDIHHNTVWANQPGGPTAFSFGIGVLSSENFGGTTANNNKVRNNVAYQNDPDLFWDGTGSGNAFNNNQCNTSVPPGLCE